MDSAAGLQARWNQRRHATAAWQTRMLGTESDSNVLCAVDLDLHVGTDDVSFIENVSRVHDFPLSHQMPSPASLRRTIRRTAQRFGFLPPIRRQIFRFPCSSHAKTRIAPSGQSRAGNFTFACPRYPTGCPTRMPETFGSVEAMATTFAASPARPFFPATLISHISVHSVSLSPVIGRVDAAMIQSKNTA